DRPDGAKFIVLSGAGADFCAGRQSPMPPAGERPSIAQLRARVAEPVLDFYDVVRSVPIPVLAVIRGRAAGVGCALAGLAELAIADETADFSIPEMGRDIPPLLVMTALAERVGRTALARLVLTRAPIDAAEAVRIGLIGEAVAPDA